MTNKPLKQPSSTKGLRIPDNLLPELVLMRTEGKPLAMMQEWLQKTHNIDVHQSNISRRLKTGTKLNRSLAKAIYARASFLGAENVVKTVVEETNIIRNVSMQLLQEGNISEALKWKQALGMWLDRSTNLFEISHSDKEDELDDIEELLSKLNNTNVTPNIHAAALDADFEQTLMLEEKNEK